MVLCPSSLWDWVCFLQWTGKEKKIIYNNKKQSNYETLKFHKLQAQKIVIYDIAVYWMELYIHP